MSQIRHCAHAHVWKTIEIGLWRNTEQIRSSLAHVGSRTSKKVNELLERIVLTDGVPSYFSLAVVAVWELGFSGATNFGQIRQRARSNGLSLCPAETAPLLRYQYAHQPPLDRLIVAMRPLYDSAKEAWLFSLGNTSCGIDLAVERGYDSAYWGMGTRFIFWVQRKD